MKQIKKFWVVDMFIVNMEDYKFKFVEFTTFHILSFL